MNEVNKKESNKIFVISLLVLIFLSLGVIGYIKKMNSPYTTIVKAIFKKVGNSASDFINDYNHANIKISFNMKDEEYKYLNDLSFNLQSHYNEETADNLNTINILKNGTNLLNLEALLKDKKLYISSKELINKVISFDANEFANKEKVDVDNIEIDKKDIELITKKLEEALKQAFKDEKLNNETEVITIKGKEEKVKNSYYVIDNKNVERIIINFLKVFKNEQVYNALSRITGTTIDEIKEFINDLEINSSALNGATDVSYKLNIYTIGFNNNPIGFSIKLNDETILKYLTDEKYLYIEQNGMLSRLFVEQNDSNLNFGLSLGDYELLNGTMIKSDNNNYRLDITIAEMITLNVDIELLKTSKVEVFDISNAVKYENLSENDIQTIQENLIKIVDNLGLLNAAKVNVFVSQAESVYKSAQQNYVADQLRNIPGIKTYYSGGNNKLNINTNSDFEYCVIINESGKMTKFAVADGSYVVYITDWNGTTNLGRGILLSDITAGTTTYTNVFKQLSGILGCANDTGTLLHEPKKSTLVGSFPTAINK